MPSSLATTQMGEGETENGLEKEMSMCCHCATYMPALSEEEHATLLQEGEGGRAVRLGLNKHNSQASHCHYQRSHACLSLVLFFAQPLSLGTMPHRQWEACLCPLPLLPASLVSVSQEGEGPHHR